MFTLTSDFDDSFEWNNNTFTVCMNFDNILKLFELFNDKLIHEIEKPIISLEMLINEELPEFDSYEEAYELFKFILKEFLDIDLDDAEVQENKTKIYDFEKDADIIYASFFAAYKIDLFEMQGNLHWKKFMALLSHLDDESKFKKVIGFRTMDVPSSKHTSKEYVNHIRKMKEIYSLDERDPNEKIEDAFSSVASIFKK